MRRTRHILYKNSVAKKFRYIKSHTVSYRHACKAISGLITANISARVPLMASILLRIQFSTYAVSQLPSTSIIDAVHIHLNNI